MSLAAHLFNSSTNSDQSLYTRITPSVEQFAEQQERWNDLADFLKPRLKEDSEYPISTWLQGSYKFDTQIRPWTKDAQFDIDLGVYFSWNGSKDDGNFKPFELKQLVQGALEDYHSDASNDSTGVDTPKERCSRIHFNADFHIDVPCYHLNKGDDERSLATENSGWEDSDPKAIYLWFRELHVDAKLRAQLRRLVCYFKMWSALNVDERARPSSILLTVLIAESYNGDSDFSNSDDDVLEQIIKDIIDRFNKSLVINNPVQTDENLNRLSDDNCRSFLTKLEEFHSIATRANKADSIAKAAEIWSEAFAHFFPLPEDLDKKSLTSLAEDSLTKTTAIVAYTFDPQISVKAISNDNKNFERNGTNSLSPIPKNCSITFRLDNYSDLPQGATIRWMVRNNGREAWNRNDIGHHAGHAKSITENSEYVGKHSMDIAVYQFGRIIGRRRVEIEVTGLNVPPRNGPMKRNYRVI